MCANVPCSAGAGTAVGTAEAAGSLLGAALSAAAARATGLPFESQSSRRPLRPIGERKSGGVEFDSPPNHSLPNPASSQPMRGPNWRDTPTDTMWAGTLWTNEGCRWIFFPAGRGRGG